MSAIAPQPLQLPCLVRESAPSHWSASVKSPEEQLEENLHHLYESNRRAKCLQPWATWCEVLANYTQHQLVLFDKVAVLPLQSQAKAEMAALCLRETVLRDYLNQARAICPDNFNWDTTKASDLMTLPSKTEYVRALAALLRQYQHRSEILCDYSNFMRQLELHLFSLTTKSSTPTATQPSSLSLKKSAD